MKEYDIILRKVDGYGWLGIVKAGNREVYRTFDFCRIKEDALAKVDLYLLKEEENGQD